MPVGSASTGLTITNPLVLYRSLLATKRIQPDQGQHRLAIHLQKLYNRLKDYEPKVEYRHELHRLTSVLEKSRVVSGSEPGNGHPPGSILSSLRGRKLGVDTLALARRLTDYESAVNLQSPQGLLLHGEVGTGKSMLIDLLASSLPSSRKRRWHFNTFMLETFARLEKLRIEQSKSWVDSSNPEVEHSLLVLARDMISTSPIIFLDEFQFPDRAASKLLSNLFTSFFHLGGVLVATSNRMPEELIKATGIDFAPPSASSRFSNLRKTLLGQESIAYSQQKSDFAAFLDVLRARCEIWHMEGNKDWRRHDLDETLSVSYEEALLDTNLERARVRISSNKELQENVLVSDAKAPPYYFSIPSTELSKEPYASRWEEAVQRTVLGISRDQRSAFAIPWKASTIRVYNRDILVTNHHEKVAMFAFDTLCATNLGPADYISIASSFHTIILTGVPILDLLHKNEARRFITLLDALYESRVKLLIQAEAGPDQLFFPETRSHSLGSSAIPDNGEGDDEIYPETLSEIYQDQTSPFRPNVSSYTSSSSPPAYGSSQLPFSEYRNGSPDTRSVLADEDSDFGPTYGAERSLVFDERYHLPDLSRNVSQGTHGLNQGPNFQQMGTFTGEDERFAYKRAKSRLWEMCGKKWWDRQDEGWWKPLDKENRPWESTANQTDDASTHANSTLLSREAPTSQEVTLEHSVSPFRTMSNPPPKISWVHAWGMMKWGKKAGDWGKGVEGLGKKRPEDRNDTTKE